MNNRQRKKGVVIKNSTEKTLVVEVSHIKKHKIYGKRYNRDKKYFVHSEESVDVGKEVLIEESKPFSKKKRWRLVEILDNEDN